MRFGPLGILGILALSTLAFATCSRRAEDSMSEIAPATVVDLTKETNREKQTSWTGKALADMVDISQVEQIIVLDSVSSATPQTLSVVIVGILSEYAAFEDIPQAVSQQRAPIVQALIMLKDGDFLRVTVWNDWARITSAQGSGTFRWTFPGQKKNGRSQVAGGMSIEDINTLANRIGVDLSFKPNLKKNRLWQEGRLSDVIDPEQIEKLVVYRSATGDVIEGNRNKIRQFIENGHAVESIDSGVSPTHRQDEVPVIEAVIVTRSKAYYRIVIRDNEAQITSIAGHGYFAVASDPD